MTSQVLIPNHSSEVSNSSTADRQPETTPQMVASTTSKRSVAALEAVKLPYQVDHQVELLHLRAEAEALLQELQTLKQRRLIAVGSAESHS